MRQTRVLVADDNGGFGELLGRFVGAQEGISVVGLASDGLEAVSMTATLGPDVVLMDLFMPGMSGFEATRILADRFPRVRVVALSAHKSAENERRSIEAGAAAFVPKVDADMRLIDLIRGADSGSGERGGEAGS